MEIEFVRHPPNALFSREMFRDKHLADLPA